MPQSTSLLEVALAYLIFPTTEQQLSVCYGIWVILYMFANIFWDIFSDETPKFGFSMLPGKLSTFFNAATFGSGMLMFFSAFKPETRVLVSQGVAYMMLAGAACILHGLGAFSPVDEYKKRASQNNLHDSDHWD